MWHNDNSEKYNYLDLPGQVSQTSLCTPGTSIENIQDSLKKNQQKQRTRTWNTTAIHFSKDNLVILSKCIFKF